jgi:hypothetical protein
MSMSVLEKLREGYDLQSRLAVIETRARKLSKPLSKVFESVEYCGFFNELHKHPGVVPRKVGSYAYSARHVLQTYLNVRYLEILSD